MTLALDIVVVAVTALTVLATLALFVWGAVKDGQDEAAFRSRYWRRRWPAGTEVRRRARHG